MADAPAYNVESCGEHHDWSALQGGREDSLSSGDEPVVPHRDFSTEMWTLGLNGSPDSRPYGVQAGGWTAKVYKPVTRLPASIHSFSEPPTSLSPPAMSTSTSFHDPSRSQRPWGAPPRLVAPPVRDSSMTPPIQLVSELDEVRAHYPPDRRNPMDLDFICHNSMKYRCCFCEERILVHESELVLDRFFEKHRCPKRRERSAETSTPPASPIGDNLSASYDQYSCRDYTQGSTGMHGGSYVWNIKDPGQQAQTRLSYIDWLVEA